MLCTKKGHPLGWPFPILLCISKQTCYSLASIASRVDCQALCAPSLVVCQASRAFALVCSHQSRSYVGNDSTKEGAQSVCRDRGYVAAKCCTLCTKLYAMYEKGPSAWVALSYIAVYQQTNVLLVGIYCFTSRLPSALCTFFSGLPSIACVRFGLFPPVAIIRWE